MKKQIRIALLFVVVILIASCKKDDGASSNVSGSLTAKFSFLDPVTKKWSPDQNFTATSVVTTKTSNDYSIVAKDGKGNTVTLAASGVTAPGTYPLRGAYNQGTKSYTGGSGQMLISALTPKSMAATVILEATDWSFYEGKLTAKF